MPDFLLIRLEGPLLAFGGETVDARGVIVDFPGRSTLTGLFANALGWKRTERARHARLQERIVFAARIDREGHRLTDFQTAQLGGGDRGWTTRGAPEGRAGGAGTYLSPHIRRRDYHADAAVTVALALEPPGEAPDLSALAAALEEPVRPLFLGRKPCVPLGRLSLGLHAAANLTSALLHAPLAEAATSDALRLMLPLGESAGDSDEIRYIADERNWLSGVHGGARRVRYRAWSRPQPLSGEPA